MSEECVIRRYDGRTTHADWCRDHDHAGYCIDRLLDQMAARQRREYKIGGVMARGWGAVEEWIERENLRAYCRVHGLDPSMVDDACSLAVQQGWDPINTARAVVKHAKSMAELDGPSAPRRRWWQFWK